MLVDQLAELSRMNRTFGTSLTPFGLGVDVDVLGVRRRDRARAATRRTPKAQLARGGQGIAWRLSAVIQGQALAVSVVRERTAIPWLTAAVAWLRASLTTALTFHSLSAHSESPVDGAAPAVSMPGFVAMLEPRQARSPSDAGSSSLTFRTRTR